MVGSQIRKFCGRYIACDVVPGLIDFIKRQFEDLDVEFKLLDLVKDEFPAGDVALIRQVLQHLSNDQIARFVARSRVVREDMLALFSTGSPDHAAANSVSGRALDA
jgi:hypothetical protein